jgi:hypothetical protein
VTRHAYERLRAGEPMRDGVEIDLEAPLGRVIDDLLLLIEASRPEDIEGQVLYLPL